MHKALIKFDKPAKFLEVKTFPLISFIESDACFYLTGSRNNS